jgi:hypothetical protein
MVIPFRGRAMLSLVKDGVEGFKFGRIEASALMKAHGWSDLRGRSVMPT